MIPVCCMHAWKMERSGPGHQRASGQSEVFDRLKHLPEERQLYYIILYSLQTVRTEQAFILKL